MGDVVDLVRDRLRSSYWFLPAVMLVVAAGLAWSTITLDQVTDPEDLPVVGPFLYAGSTEGAREILGTIAASMITVAGVVFSITIVTLQLASAQFGPRVLSTFMRDRGQQATLGTFVSAFLYSLLILRVLRSDDSSVPHLSVTVAVMIAVAGLLVLIYFVHHVAMVIQAPNLVAAIADELRRATDSLFPDPEPIEGVQRAPTQRVLPADFEERARRVESGQVGYVQTVDLQRLLRICREHDLVIRLDTRPGRFVGRRSTVAVASPDARVVDGVAAEIAAALLVGARRSHQQDVEFPIQQLTEVAIRALSPSINDPFTASTCVEQAGAALCELATRRMPSPHLVDESGALRIVVRDPVTWDKLVGEAFDQVRQCAGSHVPVLIHLLESLARVASCVEQVERLQPLEREARLVLEAAEENVPAAADRQSVRRRYDAFHAVAERQRGGGKVG
ncbi:DUF2254 domain-containing protein [Isoptericola sp. S6320L]|uniref:DUF2254 domain-containing protein n=1 Tax=Isoptericola sp. S6320L TaxID=2926411 RepID=UPI001FF56946|nr:DUF2254 domain-containing protein [Isoptericola sp. S6320L]